MLSLFPRMATWVVVTIVLVVGGGTGPDRAARERRWDSDLPRNSAEVGDLWSAAEEGGDRVEVRTAPLPGREVVGGNPLAPVALPGLEEPAALPAKELRANEGVNPALISAV